jgi:hypothetical protein
MPLPTDRSAPSPSLMLTPQPGRTFGNSARCWRSADVSRTLVAGRPRRARPVPAPALASARLVTGRRCQPTRMRMDQRNALRRRAGNVRCLTCPPDPAGAAGGPGAPRGDRGARVAAGLWLRAVSRRDLLGGRARRLRAS